MLVVIRVSSISVQSFSYFISLYLHSIQMPMQLTVDANFKPTCPRHTFRHRFRLTVTESIGKVNKQKWAQNRKGLWKGEGKGGSGGKWKWFGICINYQLAIGRRNVQIETTKRPFWCVTALDSLGKRGASIKCRRLCFNLWQFSPRTCKSNPLHPPSLPRCTLLLQLQSLLHFGRRTPANGSWNRSTVTPLERGVAGPCHCVGILTKKFK